MSKHLHFVYEWIGPRGPIINTKIPDIYDLAKSMPDISWANKLTATEVNPISTCYRNYVPTVISSVYELGNIRGKFIYELTMSFKRAFETSSLQSGIGVFENVPVDEGIRTAINCQQGWLLISNHHESFVDDYTINKIYTYLTEHNIDLSRVIYLSNCMNGQEIYERYCLNRNLEPKINFEYAGIYLLDHIKTANDPRLVDRKYTVGTRKKTFLNFNRRYRPHRFIFLLKLYERGMLDKCHISFARSQPGSLSWLEVAKDIATRKNIRLTDEQLLDIDRRLPLVLDSNDFHKFPMEQDVYEETSRFYDESLVHIISETNFHEEIIHITEKTMKPIMFKQPFIIVGPRHSLKYLKDMGFRTFDNIWDESYDDEPNSEKRMNMIMNVMEQIDKLSDADKILLQRNVEPLVEYNYEQLKTREPIELLNFCNKYGTII